MEVLQNSGRIKSSAVACIGAGLALGTAALGGAELVIENVAVSAVLVGSGLTLGGATLATDVSAVVVKVTASVKKTVAKDETKKK